MIRTASLLILCLTFIPAFAQEVKESQLSCFDLYEQARAQGDYPQAESYLLHAIEALPSSPSNALLWSNIALMRQAMGKDQEALEAFNQALNLMPSVTTILTNRAMLLSKMGRFPQALQDCDRALKVDSTLLNVRAFHCSLNLLLGHKEKAFQDCTLLEALSPYALETHQAWAQYLLDSERYKDALPHLDAIIKELPESQDLADRALCNIMLQNYSSASEDLEKALTLTPENPQFLRLRAMLYDRQYRHDEAQKDLKKAIEIERRNGN